MKRVWISLLVFLVFVSLAALTKSWWFPEGLRDRWHETWIKTPVSTGDPKEMLREEHVQLLVKMENEYREKIDEQRRLHVELLKQWEHLKGSLPTR
jgi:hypothetical protein